MNVYANVVGRMVAIGVEVSRPMRTATCPMINAHILGPYGLCWVQIVFWGYLGI